ncbi:hypothetical protein FB567DRAFT_554653 [Paraphoma chrysanthemicola]|uniref:Uncharacterized protein n=1 Tax=Paraphoma chrysanthemicola TaxID=798071 RepID=A0A8K0QTQ4_9PLEO|nr:hypothetical protein FB567DRAFT_554653 [Paraphoma chrysanthemicola]
MSSTNSQPTPTKQSALSKEQKFNILREDVQAALPILCRNLDVTGDVGLMVLLVGLMVSSVFLLGMGLVLPSVIALALPLYGCWASMFRYHYKIEAFGKELEKLQFTQDNSSRTQLLHAYEQFLNQMPAARCETNLRLLRPVINELASCLSADDAEIALVVEPRKFPATVHWVIRVPREWGKIVLPLSCIVFTIIVGIMVARYMMPSSPPPTTGSTPISTSTQSVSSSARYTRRAQWVTPRPERM